MPHMFGYSVQIEFASEDPNADTTVRVYRDINDEKILERESAPGLFRDTMESVVTNAIKGDMALRQQGKADLTPDAEEEVDPDMAARLAERHEREKPLYDKLGG